MAVIPFFTAGQQPTAEALDNACSTGAVVFHAFRDAVQSISNASDSTANAISWDDIQLDRQGAWSAGNPTRWTCQFSGWYTLNGTISYATTSGNSGGTFRQATWFKNGALLAASRGAPDVQSTIPNTLVSVYARHLPVSVVAGDYIELVGVHNANTGTSPFPLDTATGSYRPSISITYSGPM